MQVNHFFALLLHPMSQGWVVVFLATGPRPSLQSHRAAGRLGPVQLVAKGTKNGGLFFIAKTKANFLTSLSSNYGMRPPASSLSTLADPREEHYFTLNNVC